jgi:hypothetical protein
MLLQHVQAAAAVLFGLQLCDTTATPCGAVCYAANSLQVLSQLLRAGCMLTMSKSWVYCQVCWLVRTDIMAGMEDEILLLLLRQATAILSSTL